ncbi:uncharacterized protein LOC131050096 isoform X2 [Cryptomeria japonica]|uniref:uncharacterized protein LOC131050096 isoform X2 n=1 Tax=Cryptomeria japonica TaxID=3369 RepID=UPI0027DA7D48|nr:uncharacterized protein LOC131050096 isoform X2 [Cryptomeria japonica]
MLKRKERSLEQLYKLHAKLTKPRLTAVLEGNCHMQGPADEFDSETETDLENNRGAKLLTGSSSDKMDTCMDTNFGSECETHVKNSIVEHAESNIAKLSTIDAIERKEILVRLKEREPDNILKTRSVRAKMGDLAATSLQCHHNMEKGQCVNCIEESGKVVKDVYSPQSYCEGSLILCGEKTDENHAKCSPEELQRLSLGCESVQYFNLRSKGAPQLADLDAQECCDNLESVIRVDLNLEVPSRKNIDGNERESLRDTSTTNTHNKKNPNMLLSEVESRTDQRDQPVNKLMESSRETFYMSPDLPPGSDLGTNLASNKHKETILKFSTKSELPNTECDKRIMALPEDNEVEKEYNATDRLTKFAENVVDQSHACVEEITSTVRQKVDLSGIEHLSDVSDDLKTLSNQESLDPHDHNMPIQTFSNSNVTSADACANTNVIELRSITECTKLLDMSSPSEIYAIRSPLQKETQKRYAIKENTSQEMVISSILGSSDLCNVNDIMPTKDIEPQTGCKQGNSLVPLYCTDHITFPVSKQPVGSMMQENMVSVTKPFSDAQGVKYSMNGHVGNNLVPGVLVIENLQPSKPSEAVNLLTVEATPDKIDVGNQMDLDERQKIDKMDVEPSEIKRATVASALVFEDPLHEADSTVVSGSVFEDPLHEPDLVEDDVKVCDICGDAGHEDKLAICSKCNDGAEHIYCMQIMLEEVPKDNWLCEGCKTAAQIATMRKAERTQSFMSKTASLSSKKQSSNESSHSRSSFKTDKNKSDPERKRILDTSSSHSSTKRRPENLDIGPATKKQVIEARSVQQGISSSNAKQVLSREKSFKSTDGFRTKVSVSGTLSGNHVSSGHHNGGKSSAATGAQSPRLHAGMQSSKSRFTSVNSLTSDSSPCTSANSNAASYVSSTLSDKATLSSKLADVRPSSSLASRLSNTTKPVTIPKTKKDFGDVCRQASIIRERSNSGQFSKVINDSPSFKSKASINVSTIVEPRMLPNVQNGNCNQTKEARVGKPKKDGTDSVTRKPVLKSGNMVDDLKPALNGTTVSQATITLGLPKKDTCKSTPATAVAEEKSIVVPSPVVTNIMKEECDSTVCSGFVDIKSESLATDSHPSSEQCNIESTSGFKLMQVSGSFGSHPSSEQCNIESTSGFKLMQVSGSFGVPIDKKGCSSPNEKLVNIDLQSPRNIVNDDKPKSFVSSWTRTLLPDATSTRCYKCKELGHTAQFCSNRSSVNTCNNSLRVSTLKLSAAKNSREMSRSSSGKWNNSSETIVPNYTAVCENDETSEQRFLPSDGQELEGRAESNFPGQLFANDAALFPKESAGVSGKPDGENYMSQELSLLNSDFVKDLSSGTLDWASDRCKDYVINQSSTTASLSGEVPSSPTCGKKRTKGSNDAQVYLSQKLYFDGDGPLISPGDYCKLAVTMTNTVRPTESTVTAVRRNIPCDLSVYSNGNYPGKSMRVPIYQQSTQSESGKMAALPEHNFLWQGGFEVRSKGNPTNHYDGLQAHASTCAARKALDATKKFSSSILLEEVPRLSSWPMQFQYSCPSDENVALYFFAKDLESYERSYKKLLEHMLKNDFALRTNSDGVELLIFPSNQLPEKSQRWNRLLYLWGVFRERKANCIDSSAYPHERIHGQLSTNVITAGNLSSKIAAARVLPSMSVAGFSEREDMDIDMEGGQEGPLTERDTSGLGGPKSQISSFSPTSSSSDKGKTKGSDVQNASDFVEQKLTNLQKNAELTGEDKLSFKKHSPKLSSEFGQHSKASYTNKEKQKSLRTDDGRAVVPQPFGQSVMSQISSWRERANSACLGRIPSGHSAVSSSSMERQDNSSDSSRIAQVSSHSQMNTEKEKIKSKDDENDRGRERAKDLEYASFRSKDLGHKEWKPRERENERERERNGEMATERDRDRRISSRRHEEHNSHEQRPRRDSREDRRHHFSHSPTQHASRSNFSSMRISNYDHHHYRMRSPDFDQNRHVQMMSGVEASGGSRRRDTVSPRGRSSDCLIDDKGHRKLKKSYSEIYVRDICKDEESSCRSSGGRSSAELNICIQTQQVSDLSASVQFDQDSKEYNPLSPKESQVTERFFFPEPTVAERNDKTTKSSEQSHIKQITKPKSPELTSDDQCIPSVEDLQEPPDLDVPDLELALGAKLSSPKPAVRPLFVQLHDKSYTQQQSPSPTTSEDGSSLSLSLTFPLPSKEQAVKSALKESESLCDNGTAYTSLLLFGSSVDSNRK